MTTTRIPPSSWEPIETRVRALETKERLDLDDVARAIAAIKDPDVLRVRLGAPVRYSQRVEADVASLGIDTLLPHEPVDHLGRFLTVWVPDELGHAASQEMLLEAIGFEPSTPRDPDHVPFHNRIAGILGRISGHAHDIVSMTYHSIGSLNERLAMGAYHRMTAIAEEPGEHELATRLLRPTYRDEAFHLGYYRTTALQLRAHLQPWKVAVARALIVRTYFPVGAGAQEDRAPFGEVVIALEDDPENPTIADAIHDIAQDLLARPERELTRFAHKTIRSCIALAQQASPAPR